MFELFFFVWLLFHKWFFSLMIHTLTHIHNVSVIIDNVDDKQNEHEHWSHVIMFDIHLHDRKCYVKDNDARASCRVYFFVVYIHIYKFCAFHNSQWRYNFVGWHILARAQLYLLCIKYDVTVALPINFHFSLICTLFSQNACITENQRIKFPFYFMNKKC